MPDTRVPDPDMQRCFAAMAARRPQPAQARDDKPTEGAAPAEKGDETDRQHAAAPAGALAAEAEVRVSSSGIILDWNLRMPEGRALQSRAAELDRHSERPLGAADSVVHALSRITVAYDSTDRLPVDQQVRDMNVYGPLNQRLHRGTDTLSPQGIFQDPAHRTKQEQLLDTVAAVRQLAELHYAPDVDGGDGVIDWGTAIAETVAQAEGMSPVSQPQERQQCLRTAIVMSQLASTAEDRINLLDTIARNSIPLHEVVQALRGSSIALLYDAPGAAWGVDSHTNPVVCPLASIATVFEQPPEVVDEYLGYLQEQAGERMAPAVGSPRFKQLETVIADNPPGSPEAVEAAALAEQIVLNGPHVAGILLDPTKAERFGLQRHFMNEQVAAWLGTTPAELADPPLMRFLAATSPSDEELRAAEALRDSELKDPEDIAAVEAETFYGLLLEEHIAELAKDLELAMSNASDALITEYQLPDGYNGDTSRLTPSQKYNARYQTVGQRIYTHNEVARFVDREFFHRVKLREQVTVFEPDDSGSTADFDIWNAAAAGGSTGETVKHMLTALITAAATNEINPLPTPDELLSALMANRTSAFRLAGANGAEFQVSELKFSHAELARGEDGVLQVQFFVALPEKGSLGSYAGATVACPALRITHEARDELTVEEREQLGSANFIDHLLAIAFREAYRRGILDVTRYKG